MVIQSEEINMINSHLSERGDKKKLAKYLGIHPNNLSRFFRFNLNVNGWVWPKWAYQKTLEFIKQG